MLVKKPLITHVTLAVLSLSSGLLSLLFTEPCTTYSANNFCKTVNTKSAFFLYLSSILFFYAAFTTILYVYRFNTKTESLKTNIQISSREGLILSLVINSCLGLSSLNLLNAISITLICLLAFFAELIFITQIDN